jgi:dynactin 1
MAESELEDVKERLAIAEVELDIIREGRQAADGDASNVKSSLVYI